MKKAVVLLSLLILVLLPACKVVPDQPGYSLRVTTPTAAPLNAYSDPAAALAELAAGAGEDTSAKSIFGSSAMYAQQAGSPVLTRAFLHTESGCNWMGAAGQLFDTAGQPVTGLIVAVVGNAGSQSVEAVTTTGVQSGYGPGGYELKLADQVTAGIFWMQAFSSNGSPLTDVVEFQLSGECAQNLALFNFRDTSQDQDIFLPIIGH